MSVIPDWLLRGNARDEDETPRDGFLSTTKEIHAAGVGAGFGLLTAITGEPAIALFFAAVVMGRAKVSSGHLRDAAREAGYALGAFVLLYLVGSVL